MPSILSENDKEIVKRTVPKASNKIQAVAIARLYIAYPNRQRWTYTGLQGAAVLANDLIGNTFWIKLVDISVSVIMDRLPNRCYVLIRFKPMNRGVVWDQEIYDTFSYNQDRTFFHTFELENCLAGLSFADEKEAKTFKKKMDEREKNASKNTKATPFHGLGPMPATAPPEKHHSRLGSLLHGHRSASNSGISSAQIQPAKSAYELYSVPQPLKAQPSATSRLDEVDPSWRGMIKDLLALGITEDQIEENADFIKTYIEGKQAQAGQDGTLEDRPNGISHEKRAKAPPPPPPPAAPPGATRSISPQNTGNNSSSRRGPPPALPPARRSRVDSQAASSPQSQATSLLKTPERTPSPPRAAHRFRAPPPIADAGKYAGSNGSGPPVKQRTVSNQENPGPPPPPRPPKTPMDDDIEAKSRFGVPPPFQSTQSSPMAPTAANRGPLPPPRTLRDSPPMHVATLVSPAPPPLPPKTLNGSISSTIPVAPPPPPPAAHRTVSSAPTPPPLPSISTRSVPPPAINSIAPPILPTLPSPNAPPPPPLPSSNVPPPPPLPSGNEPPPPPLPPGREATKASSYPKASAGTDDLLASIRGTGGIGGGRLKRVSSQEKRDRSAAIIPGTPAARSTSGAGVERPSTNGGVGLADALAQALSARNKKVSASGMPS